MFNKNKKKKAYKKEETTAEKPKSFPLPPVASTEPHAHERREAAPRQKEVCGSVALKWVS